MARVALAGVGHWHAGMHLEAARSAGAEVVAAWDPDPAVAAGFAAKHGGPRQPSVEALIAAKPDLTVVMGRPDQVPALALACIEAGLPIVLEKPAAVSTAALEPLAEAARRRDLFVAVPLPNRCGPIWVEIEALKTAGRLGLVSHAQFRIVNGPPERYRLDGVPWVLDPAIGGGGALRNLGIHGIDAALALAGGAGLAVVSASVDRRLYGEAVEEYAIVTLRAPDGMIATVEAGYTYASMAPGGDFEWRVSARNATLIDRGDSCHVATLDDGRVRDLAPILPADRYKAFMADTLDRLARGAAPSVGIADYLQAMRLIDRAYEEAAE
ncbi:Gfo/Idh/MocA family protein [Inquilinus limosus]|uniref:Gfo/Idh/MocA family protein n=1 Tax=Inquilinus limosus TaxID=171674 RepID=UPI000556E7F1|nr:Gfo/Idh/MocA family oxidoreductase [Inquilinus limosus]